MSLPLAASLALPACKRIEGSVEKPVLPLVLRGGRVFFNDHWGIRLMFRLLPWLMRTGILQWMQRKEKRLMADGVVPVRLVVY